MSKPYHPLMITHCPSCKDPINLQAVNIHEGGGMVYCPSCGHGWIEAMAIEISPDPVRPIQSFNRPGDAPDVEVRKIVSASLLAQETFEIRRRRRRTAMAAWMGLAALGLTPAAVAVAMPEKVVATAPAAIAFYDWIGREVNIYGLEIREIELQHLQVGDQRMIAVKGEFVNVSDTERRIPWLRFALRDRSNQEVYQWQLDTESRPLKPGEAKSFFTRIASPPQAAEAVEIRFARADEIGSNISP